MELILKISVIFIFSSILQGLILLLYFKMDTKIHIEKSKFINTLILLGFLHSLFQSTFPEKIVLIIFVPFSFLILALIFNLKLKQSIKSIIKFCALTIIVETVFYLIFKFGFHIDMSHVKWDVKLIIYFTPIRILEVMIIYNLKKFFIKKEFKYL